MDTSVNSAIPVWILEIQYVFKEANVDIGIELWILGVKCGSWYYSVNLKIVA